MIISDSDKLIKIISDDYKYFSFCSYSDNIAVIVRVYSFDSPDKYNVDKEKECIFDLLKLVQDSFGRPRFEVVKSWNQCGSNYETFVIFK